MSPVLEPNQRRRTACAVGAAARCGIHKLLREKGLRGWLGRDPHDAGRARNGNRTAPIRPSACMTPAPSRSPVRNASRTERLVNVRMARAIVLVDLLGALGSTSASIKDNRDGSSSVCFNKVESSQTWSSVRDRGRDRAALGRSRWRISCREARIVLAKFLKIGTIIENVNSAKLCTFEVLSFWRRKESSKRRSEQPHFVVPMQGGVGSKMLVSLLSCFCGDRPVELRTQPDNRQGDRP